MKRLLASLFFAATLASAQAPLRVALIGDSTVAPDGGWGPGFAASFYPAFDVRNHAMNGRSSKSFFDEGRWQPVLAEKPRYVLIQFGHNDESAKGPERATDPETTFRANLLRYISEAQAIGATPVLVTSIVRRNFDAEGHIKPDSLVPFVAEVRRFAAEHNVPLLDLYSLTKAQAEALGNKAAEATLGAKDKDGKPDHTHLSLSGQAAIGQLAAQEFARLFPEYTSSRHALVSWRDAVRQPDAFYSTPEALRIADLLLLHQHDNGGWSKNVDMSYPLAGKNLKDLEAQKAKDGTTIDNGATHTQLRYLARVHTAQPQPRIEQAFRRGFDYLLAAQYPNGGWPQFFPLRKGYYTHITYNDDAMAGVLTLLSDIAKRKPHFAFLNDADRTRAASAVTKGIDCILKTQIRVNGQLTVWCAQHDETTFAPAKARAYELPSYSGSESVGIVRFLMSIEQPSPEVKASITAAVAWLDAHKLTGIRLERQSAPGTPKGHDTVVVSDPQAPPLWARFYTLDSAQPLFCGRDGNPKTALADIEYERRNGYSWYVSSAAKLIDTDFPAWRARHTR